MLQRPKRRQTDDDDRLLGSSDHLSVRALLDRMGRRKPIYLLGAIGSAAGWAAMLYIPSLPLPTFIAVAARAATSFSSGAWCSGFAYAKELSRCNSGGTISGAINIGYMIGPMLLETRPGIGQLLEKNWAGQMVNSVQMYYLPAYHAAFLLIVGWAAVSCLLIAMTTETFCRPRS